MHLSGIAVQHFHWKLTSTMKILSTSIYFQHCISASRAIFRAEKDTYHPSCANQHNMFYVFRALHGICCGKITTQWVTTEDHFPNADLLLPLSEGIQEKVLCLDPALRLPLRPACKEHSIGTELWWLHLAQTLKSVFKMLCTSSHLLLALPNLWVKIVGKNLLCKEAHAKHNTFSEAEIPSSTQTP